MHNLSDIKQGAPADVFLKFREGIPPDLYCASISQLMNFPNLFVFPIFQCGGLKASGTFGLSPLNPFSCHCIMTVHFLYTHLIFFFHIYAHTRRQYEINKSYIQAATEIT